MKARRFGAILATLVSAAACLSASAAWYDNPSIVKKVPVAQNVKTHPHFINKSADDSLLLVNLNASDDNAAPVLLIDMASLADRSVAADEVAMSRPVSKPSEGFGSGWKGGAVSAKLGIALIGGGTSSETCAIATKGETWTKGAGLKPLATSNGYRIDGLDFSADSQYLYSNFYADQNGGETGQNKILRWTYDAANNQLVLDREYTTSLTRIRNISVHTVNGRELVYCGEGKGTSLAAKVVAIDVSGDTWIEHEVSSGISGLAGNITNVKLSNEDDANPVMYVLGRNGKLAVCKLAADGLSVAGMLRTFTSAEMLALAGGLSGEDEFVNFEVAKDGKTAFLIKRIDTTNANLCVLASPAYIESDGTQFINTGYYVKPTSRIELDFAFVDFANTSAYAQSRLFDNDANNSKPSIAASVYVGGSAGGDCSLAACIGDCDSSHNFAGVWTSNSGTGTKNAYCDSSKRTIVLDELNKRIAIKANGAEVWYNDQSSSRTFTHTASWPLGLFGRTKNNSGTSCDYRSIIRVYGFRIYESDALVHDYIPAIKNGVAGLLDSITGTFLYDTRTTGAGAFAYGGDIETADDPYVESNGTSAINLGIVVSPKLKIQVDYAFTDASDPTPNGSSHYQQHLFGPSGDISATVYINGAGNLSFGSSDTWAGIGTGIAADTNRRVVIIDNAARKWAFMTGVTTNWYYDTTADLTKTGTRPIALFGHPKNDAATSFEKFSKAKVYGCKIWFDGVLIRDLAPRCIDGVAGFEDLVSGDFFTCSGLTASANAQTELAGSGADDDPYIESDGTTYSFFDTHYFPGKKTKIEVDFRQTKLHSNNDCVFGNYGSTFTILLYGPVNANTLAGTYKLCGRDGTYASQELSPSVAVDLRRHKAVIDVPKQHMAMYAADGTLQGEGTMPAAWAHTVTAASWPIALFGSCDNQYGTSAKQRVYARIYGAKIWESDDGGTTYTLIRDFKPMVQGGVAGFYDEVSKKFNAGEALKAGGKIQECAEEYIENNTTSKGSFDTGLKVTDQTKVICDFMPLSDAVQKFPFEAGDSTSAASGKMFMRTYGNGNGNYAYSCGTALWVESTVPFRPYVRRELTLDAKSKQFIIGSPYGNAVQTMTIGSFSCPDESSNTLKIFSNGTSNGNYLQGRLYGFKVYNGDTLVGNYVPICQGGTYGLADKISGKVLAMASGSVAFGGDTDNGNLNDSFFDAPMRDEDAYIQSDGTQAINLGYFTTPNTRYEIDFQLTDRVGQYRPFGQANTDIQNLNAELYIQDSLNVAFGVGDTWKGHPTGIASDLNRHVAVVDFANRECGYSGYKMFAFDSSVVCKNTAVVPMWLFAKGKTADGLYGNRAKMRLYAFRIYEAGVLVHEYLPYKNGDTVGLYDTVTGGVKLNSVNGANSFVYGGMGYGKFAGVKTVLTTAPGDTSVKVRRTATLTAFAPGAVRYVWTRNGVVLAGATGSEVTVVWERPKAVGGTPVVYGVTPVFLKGGVEVLGEEASAEVTMMPLGMVLILR